MPPKPPAQLNHQIDPCLVSTKYANKTMIRVRAAKKRHCAQRRRQSKSREGCDRTCHGGETCLGERAMRGGRCSLAQLSKVCYILMGALQNTQHARLLSPMWRLGYTMSTRYRSAWSGTALIWKCRLIVNITSYWEFSFHLHRIAFWE